MREDEIIDISENEGPLGQETIEVDSNDNNEVDVMREHHIYTNIDEEVIEQMQEDIANNTDNIIQIEDSISRLQDKITSENKLQSDLVDDTNQTNKFVTTQEKETWNEKYYKPNGGIPKTDLSSEVQESLDKADTAIQESDLEDYVTNDTLEASQAIQDEKITAIEKQIPTGEVNDTSITLTDSADYKVKEFGIEGNTEQATRSGKNFFDIDKVISNWDTSTNMGVKNNSNGTLTVSTPAGSTTVLALSPNKLSDYCPNLKVGDVVYLNATTTGTNKYIYLNVSSSLWMFGASRTITQDDLDSAVYWYASGVNTTATITNIMVSTSNIDTYEPYGASPSPEYPSPVNTITGDVEVKVQNGNLFDINKNVNTRYNGETGTRNTVSGNDLTSTTNGGSTHPYGQKIYVGKGNTVTFSAILKSITYDTTPTSTTTVACLVLYNENSVIDRGIQSFNYDGIGTKKSVSITASTDYIYATFGRTSNTTSATFTDIQVEYGTTAGEYIPHQEQNYPISLGSLELCKIGDYQDYIYKENGNWYKYGNVIKRNLKDFNYSRTVLANGNILFSINLNYFGNATSINVLCSHLLGIADNQGNVLNSIRFNQGHNLYIVVADNEISSSTTNFKNWCETNNVYALFKSTNPVITPITDTTLINQLNALEKAYTYKGVTHIDTDVETKPYLKVVYRKDIGLILERIENLEARVSLLE